MEPLQLLISLVITRFQGFCFYKMNVCFISNQDTKSLNDWIALMGVKEKDYAENINAANKSVHFL